MRPPFQFKTMKPFLYLFPAAAFLLLVFIYPIFQVFRLSLLKKPTGGDLTLINYQRVIEDPIFWLSTSNNGKLLFVVPIMTVLALLVALLLYEQVRGWRFYRAIIFFPYILAIPIIATTFVYLLGRNGIINVGLREIGLGFLAQDWLGNQTWVIPSIGSAIIYRELGFGVVLFLARLLSLNKSILEAAEIDGANWWQKHIYVTLPQLSSVIKFFIIVELITALSWVFAYVFSMTGGGPGFASTVMEIYIWKHAFSYRSPGIAAAVAVILLAVTSIFIALQFRVRENSLEDGS